MTTCMARKPKSRQAKRMETCRSDMAVITSSSAPNTARSQAVIVGMGGDVDRVLSTFSATE